MIGLVLIAGQALDALTLGWFLSIAPPELHLAERNPIILALLTAGGFGLVFAFKVGLAWVVAWRIARGQRPASRLGRFLLPVAAAAGFVGVVFNLVAVATILSLTA